jgi:hypothetical protein
LLGALVARNLGLRQPLPPVRMLSSQVKFQNRKRIWRMKQAWLFLLAGTTLPSDMVRLHWPRMWRRTWA